MPRVRAQIEYMTARFAGKDLKLLRIEMERRLFGLTCERGGGEPSSAEKTAGNSMISLARLQERETDSNM